MVEKSTLSDTKVALLVILGIAYCCFLHNSKEVEQTIEGIRNMNCCGGIVSGTHYSETDKEPPEYVSRCFTSKRENDELVYNWDGRPCSQSGSQQCCGGEGKCIPTTKGGYCLDDKNSFIFNRGSSKKINYIKRSNDDKLDINNADEMIKYIDSIDGGKSKAAREKGKNLYDVEKRKLIKGHLLKKNQTMSQKKVAQINQLNEKKKEMQLISSIAFIHMLFLLSFSIIIKDDIIAYMKSIYDDFFGGITSGITQFKQA